MFSIFLGFKTQHCVPKKLDFVAGNIFFVVSKRRLVTEKIGLVT